MMKRKRPNSDEESTSAEETAAANPSSGDDSVGAESGGEESIQEDPLAIAQREAAEYRDKYQRALADQENHRKRHMTQMQESRQYAISEFAKELLEVVDNLARALDGVDDERRADPFVAGVQLVQDQLLKAMTNHGVSEVESIGRPFDPMAHSAIMEDERSDVAPGTVTEELMRGYRIGDRLLRAAMVKVARAPSASNGASTSSPSAE